MNEDNRSNARRVVIVFALIIVAFFAFLIGVVVYNNTRPNPYGESISIKGLSGVGMPKDEQDQITSNLYNEIKNRLSLEEEVPTSGAEIRSGSLSKWFDEEEKLNVAEFIVDIESVRQSYRIHIEWSSKKNILSGYPFTIRCLAADDEVKYMEFSCVDDFTLTDREEVRARLPYWGETGSGHMFLLRDQEDTDDDWYLEVDVDSCGDAEIVNEALNAAKGWVNSLGVDAEELVFYAPDYLCEGGAS